jgi:hypothetical protein
MKDLVKNNFPLEVGCAEERGASSRERCASCHRHLQALLFYENYFSPIPKQILQHHSLAIYIALLIGAAAIKNSYQIKLHPYVKRRYT